MLLAALVYLTLADPPLRVTVDARQVVTTRSVHVTEELPAPRSGVLTIEYPKWIPGMHAPIGPIKNVTRVAALGNGQPLPVRRDPFEPYAFQITVPSGVKTVTVGFDYQPRRGETDEVAYGVAVSDSGAIVNFSALVVVPRGADVTKAKIVPTLLLPDDWKRASALGDGTETTVERLVDSPVYAGKFLKTFPLGGDVPHTLAVLGDTEALAEPPAHVLKAMQRLVAESGTLFGVRHYDSFTYLFAQSNQLPVYGLEHHASSVNVLRPGGLGDGTAAPPQWNANLLPHEFVHSWCGKFRRPYGLAGTNYSAPLSTDLLFVYEGLTEYLGEVLMVRAGFSTFDAEREHLRQQLSSLDDRKARTWQSLRDAAVAFPLLSSSGDGERLRFSNDVYYESGFHWLEADAMIRRESGGTKSLDDFCREFFGGANRGAEVKPFTEGDVIAALRAVVPSYDWAGWLKKRFDATEPLGPRDGLALAGYRPGFGDGGDRRAFEGESDFRQSLGFGIGRDGSVTRVTSGPLAAGAKIVAVNGKRFTPALLRAAVRATKDAPGTIELLVDDKDVFRTVTLTVSGGEKLSVLERIDGTPDLLAAIFAPTVKAQP